MDIKPWHVGAAVGVGAAGYFGIDYLMKRNIPGASGRTAIGQLTGSVREIVQPGQVPTVKVGMPLLGANGVITDSPSTSSNNLNAIGTIAAEVFTGGAKVISAFASCESQNGSLENRCFNCSLFNIHWSSGVGYPNARVGNELIISFRTGASSDVEGFRRCLEHFRGFLERRAPQAIAAARGNDFDAFQIAIGQIDYSPGYTRTVNAGRIVNGNNFLRQRYDRLVRAGLFNDTFFR